MNIGNAYQILSDVRDDLNEFSDAYVQGTDTSGAYSNRQLMKAINLSQGMIHALLMQRKKAFFLKLVDASVVNSVYTLPPDFGSLRVFQDANYTKVFRIPPELTRVLNQEGSKKYYHEQAGTYILNKSGVTETYRIYYYWKPRELDTGMSSAGAAATVTLATTAKKRADYYNGMGIENVTDDETDTISDYTAARVATVSNTWAASKYYGIVSDLPEAFHEHIAPLATIIIKNRSVVSMEKASKEEIFDANQALVTAMGAWAPLSEDEDIEDNFQDYEPTVPFWGGILT